jgi:carbon storage regulator
VLVFTRRRNEAVVIGDGIEVRILRVGRFGVRLGVTAPSHVAVHRLEVYNQIRDENRAAAVAAAATGGILDRLRRASPPLPDRPGSEIAS